MTSEQLKAVNQKLQTMDIKGKEYVQVNERVKAFRDICPNGTIETEIVSMEGEVVVIRATIRDGETILATGLAYEKESSSYINKTSYIENCETSAVGRALGFCGIGIDGSMCSAEELVNAIQQQDAIKELEKKPATDVVKDTLKSLCQKHNVNLPKWCQQQGLKWETLSAADAAKMLTMLKAKYGDA